MGHWSFVVVAQTLLEGIESYRILAVGAPFFNAHPSADLCLIRHQSSRHIFSPAVKHIVMFYYILVRDIMFSCSLPGYNKVQLLFQAPPGNGLGVTLDNNNGMVRQMDQLEET